MGNEVGFGEEFKGIKSKLVGRCNRLQLELNVKVMLSWGLAMFCR